MQRRHACQFGRHGEKCKLEGSNVESVVLSTVCRRAIAAARFEYLS